MADRRTSVSLELKSSQFKAEADAAKVKVEGLDRSVEKLDRDITKIPPDAAKAAAAMKLLGDESGKAKVALEDGIGKGSTSLGVLDQRLTAARLEVRRLADEFNRTGDAGTLEKLFSADKAARELEQLGKRLTRDLAQGVQSGITTGGKEGAKNASAALQGLLSTAYIGPVVTAAIVAGVVAALPLIGAALNTGLGLGLIGAGIAAQFRSQQIKDAAQGLLASLKGVFFDAASSFRGPVENALLDLSAFVQHLDLRSVFQPLSQFVAPLEKGLEGFLSRLVGGLGKFATNIKPLMDVFVMHLPQLGAIISSFLERVSRNAGENASALDLLLTVVEGIVRWVGILIEAFDHMYKIAVNVALGVAEAFDKAFGWIPGVGKQLDDTVLTLGRLAAEADGGKGSMDNMSTAADGLNGAMGPGGLTGSVLGAKTAFQQLDTAMMTWKNDALDSKTSALQFKDALADLKKQMAENGAGFNENTADGRKNTEALNDLAQKAQEVADKTFAATGSSVDAARAYAQVRAEVLKLAQQGHASASEIAALNQALDDVVKVRKGTVTLEINLTGSGRALVENQKTTLLSGTGIKFQRWGGVDYAADGLIGLSQAQMFSAGSRPLYGFAEPGTGAEGFVPKNGDYWRSMNIIGEEARWYGARVVPGGAAPQSVTVAPVYHVILQAKDGASQAILDMIDVRVEQHDHRTAAAVSGGPRA